MVRNAWLQSSRVRFRMLLGMLLGIGAPLGWLSIRIVSGESFWEELRNHTGLYLVYADDKHVGVWVVWRPLGPPGKPL